MPTCRLGNVLSGIDTFRPVRLHYPLAISAAISTAIRTSIISVYNNLDDLRIARIAKRTFSKTKTDKNRVSKYVFYVFSCVWGWLGYPRLSAEIYTTVIILEFLRIAMLIGNLAIRRQKNAIFARQATWGE